MALLRSLAPLLLSAAGLLVSGSFAAPAYAHDSSGHNFHGPYETRTAQIAACRAALGSDFHNACANDGNYYPDHMDLYNAGYRGTHFLPYTSTADAEVWYYGSCPEGTAPNAEGLCEEEDQCELGKFAVEGTVALNADGESCVDGCIVATAGVSIEIEDGTYSGKFNETGGVCTGSDGNFQPKPANNCYTDSEGDTICYPMDDNPSQCGSFNGHYVCLSNMATDTCAFGDGSAVCKGDADPYLYNNQEAEQMIDAAVDPDGQTGPEEPTSVTQSSITTTTSDGTTSTGGGSDASVSESDTHTDGTACDPATEDCPMEINLGIGEAGKDGGEGVADATAEFDQTMESVKGEFNRIQSDEAWATPTVNSPMDPSGSCDPFEMRALGQVYVFDVCDWIIIIQQVLAWAFSILTAIAIFNEWRTS